ncbi:MAG: hypothetical protein JOZ07_18055 [Solirubrobacterales bacterium]|nr:hypothetical protein [Solirubrobacterales bacterium]
MARELDRCRVPAAAVPAGAILTVLALAAVLGRIGSDAQWLAALGHVIVHRRAIPSGVPFAATPTGQWPNALVLAELIFAALQTAFGDQGLMLAQLALASAGLILLARDARAGGASPVGVSAAVLLVGVGALPSLAIARVQMFSLALFPALVMLLRAEARAPSRRIWLAVPLLALWSNLHGAALIGAGVTLVYLVVDRARREPALAAAVAAGSALALCATAALARTVAYYHGVLTNQAAQRGAGMWGPLSLTSPLDIALAVVAALLVWRMTRVRPARWEWCVVAALALLTVRADRNGVWLLFFMAGPAARALGSARSLRPLTPALIAASGAVLALAIGRGPVTTGASPSLVRSAVVLAGGSPILADGSVDEQVALAGGRIWAGNPIDAFSAAVQTSYLDWLAGQRAGARAVGSAVRVVLVSRGAATQRLMARMPGFVAARSSRSVVMYERVRA